MIDDKNPRRINPKGIGLIYIYICMCIYIYIFIHIESKELIIRPLTISGHYFVARGKGEGSQPAVLHRIGGF